MNHPNKLYKWKPHHLDTPSRVLTRPHFFTRIVSPEHYQTVTTIASLADGHELYNDSFHGALSNLLKCLSKNDKGNQQDSFYKFKHNKPTISTKD